MPEVMKSPVTRLAPKMITATSDVPGNTTNIRNLPTPGDTSGATAAIITKANNAAKAR
jgi:hypothetical protein